MKLVLLFLVLTGSAALADEQKPEIVCSLPTNKGVERIQIFDYRSSVAPEEIRIVIDNVQPELTFTGRQYMRSWMTDNVDYSNADGRQVRLEFPNYYDPSFGTLVDAEGSHPVACMHVESFL